jgi:drug/metabolite transporter (DMT)-like permease
MSLAPPIGALAAMPFLGERLSAWNWLGMLVTLGGVCWVVIERRVDENGVALHPSAGGVVLGVLAAAGQAFGSVLSKVGMGDYDAFASAQIRVLTGLACFAVLLAILRWYPRIGDTLRNGPAMALITLGAFSGPFLGVALFLIAIRHITIGVAQTIVCLMPVLIIPFVIVLHKERVSWRAVIGAVVAVAGVALLFWK